MTLTAAPRPPARARPSGRRRPAPAPGPARILLTGYPGFLGSALIERLLARHGPDTRIACLVQPAFMSLATERATALTARLGPAAGRLHLVPGDITREGLGLGTEATRLLGDVRDVFHLAAVYDLGVEREFAHRVNVEGTRHVLEFASALPGLRRLHYVSTCYVSGRLPGPFLEADLERGQAFGNAYEETKHRAEVAVRAAMARGLPATIYRPAIVVGVPGVADPQKLLNVAARIGVKDAKRFLVKNLRFVTGMARSGGFYKPTGFVEAMAPLLADPTANVTGFHLYTFNAVEATETWRRSMLEG